MNDRLSLGSRGMRRSAVGAAAGLIAKWAYLLFLLGFALIPLLWLLVTSLKTQGEFLTYPLSLPETPRFSNYVTAFQMARLHVLLINSIITASFATVLNLSVTAAAAFVLTRQRVRWAPAVNGVILLGVLIPIISFMVPYLSLVRAIKLYNTRAALILVYAAINLPISYFIVSTFMREIPRSLEEAAVIEGASSFQRLVRVILPLSTAGLLTAGTLCFIYAWNEFAYALLLTSSSAVRTVQLGISFFNTQFRSDYPAMFAAIAVAMVPTVTAYVMLHDRIIGGLTAGAIKG